jgi:hypothetical protein
MRVRSFVVIFLGALLCAGVVSHGADAKKKPAGFEVQLLWGTDMAKSPNPDHKPLDPDVEKTIKSLPLKFKHYFLVNRNRVIVPPSTEQSVNVSEKCAVMIKNLDNMKFQVTFIGKSKQQTQRTQEFPLHEMLVHGGNAPGSNAWLVVVKRIE